MPKQSWLESKLRVILYIIYSAINFLHRGVLVWSPPYKSVHKKRIVGNNCYLPFALQQPMVTLPKSENTFRLWACQIPLPLALIALMSHWVWRVLICKALTNYPTFGILLPMRRILIPSGGSFLALRSGSCFSLWRILIPSAGATFQL